MASHKKAMWLKAKPGPLNSGLFYLLHNLVDLIWQAPHSQEPVYVQGIEFTGMSTNYQRVVSHITSIGKDALYKLDKLRGWIKQQPVFTLQCEEPS